jgi:hypothetical protein
VREKKHPKPAWYKNTYFWIAGILFLIGVIGLPFLAGPDAIRDPGQRRENGLSLIYFGGALLMFINGWLSHRQTVQIYLEETGGAEPNAEPTPVADGAAPLDSPRGSESPVALEPEVEGEKR